MAQILMRKLPDGVLRLVTGELPLDIRLPDGPGDYEVFSVSDPLAVSLTGEALGTRPQNSALPELTGTGEPGTDLIYRPGVWSNASQIVVQLLRDDIAIPGETGGTPYRVSAHDRRSSFRVRERAINGSGPSDAISNPLVIPGRASLLRSNGAPFLRPDGFRLLLETS